MSATLTEQQQVPILFIIELLYNYSIETAMGVKIHAHDNSGSDYVRAVYDVGASLIKRMVKPWHWFDIFYTVSAEGHRYSKNLDTLHSFTRKVE